jgi:hypothetical protein
MKHTLLSASLGILALLAGCSDVSDSLGFGRNPPDEFAVVDRPPLTIPPDFNLRPPRPGAPRPQDSSATRQASKLLFGSDARVTTTADRNAFGYGGASGDPVRSDAEKALLSSAGAEHAEQDIRQLVDREAAQKVVGSRHLVDELLWWRKTEPPAAVVDAPAEAERLKEVKESDEPVNKGATPIIERKKSGWLGL